MLKLARLLALAGVVAFGAFSLAANLSLINHEAMGTYRQALAETDKNRTKSVAMLRALLVQTVTIGIDSGSVPKGGEELVTGVEDGIHMWNTSLGETLFVPARPGEKPDVLVQFVEKVNNGNHAQGMVKAQRHFYWKDGLAGGRITGTIYIRDNVGRRSMRADEVSRVMAHELGHLLGLDDDHDGPGLMGDFVPGKGITKPSRLELDAVVNFRELLRGALEERLK